MEITYLYDNIKTQKLNKMEPYTENYMQELRNRGYIIASLFHHEDIIHMGKELGYNLTQDEINEIHMHIEDTFDANIGLNWDVIEAAIEYVKN